MFRKAWWIVEQLWTLKSSKRGNKFVMKFLSSQQPPDKTAIMKFIILISDQTKA